MDTNARTAVEIPYRLQPGEIWFYLELALIDDVPGLYALLKTINLTPQLAYMQTPYGIEILLLLAHEQRETLVSSPDGYYCQEQHILANFINTEAMHCRARMTKSLAAVA